MKGITPFFLAVAAFLSFIAPALSAESAAGLSQNDTFRIISEAKARVFPAVVFIKPIVESYERGEKEAQEVTGSGVLISAAGEILTNYHVVENAVSIRCMLYDGAHYDAKIVGSDKETDLALIKLQADEGAAFASAEIGDSTTLKEGDFVMAMGAPWGLNRSVSLGIISCTRRYIPDSSEYSLWLQTDAALNPGNSGGPLVNTSGEVIGINALAVMEGGDLGFAIPAETLKHIIPHLRKNGKVERSWTGLRLQPLKDFNQNMYFDAEAGFIVAGSDPASPAAYAGLAAGDRITKVAGREVTAVTDVDLPAVRSMLAMLPADEAATFEVYRNGSQLEIEIAPIIKGKVEGEELDLPRWNMTVKTVNKFDNPELWYFVRGEGVFIFGTKYPGNAAESGLRSGDILRSIDGEEVKTLEEVETAYKAIVEAESRRTRVAVEYIRGGVPRQAVLDFSKNYESD
jgi:S1-C subfamily serine protease